MMLKDLRIKWLEKKANVPCHHESLDYKDDLVWCTDCGHSVLKRNFDIM